MADTDKPTAPPAPPEGVHSDFHPPEAVAKPQLRDAIERFDKQVSDARGQPSLAMQALKLAELVKDDLPEDLRYRYEQLRYEVYPKKDGGLGLQVDFRRDRHAAGDLRKLRELASTKLAQKRTHLANSGV